MRKTALTAAGLVMGVVSMAGIAYAAGPSGPIATDTTSVTHSVVDDHGHAGADDPVSHDVSGRAPMRTVTIPGPSAAHVSDDPAGHDATDGHGTSGSYTGHEFGWNARHDSDHDSGHGHGADG